MALERVLLINPPLYRDATWDPIRISQPLGIWSIGTYIQKSGHDVKLLCADMGGFDNQCLYDTSNQLLDIPFNEFYQKKSEQLGCLPVKSFHSQYIDNDIQYVRIGLETSEILQIATDYAPTIIGISSCYTCNHQAVVDLAMALRKHFGSNITIVAGGQHATALPLPHFEDSKGAINFIVKYEAEIIFTELVNNLNDKKYIRSMPNVVFHENGRISDNKRAHYEHNNNNKFARIEVIYDLEPSLMEDQGYTSHPSHTYQSGGRKYTDIMFSLGCHRACAFCFAPQMRGKLRWLDSAQIKAMLIRIRDAGYEELVLQDDDLLHDIRFFELLDIFVELGFSWQNNGGVEFESITRERVNAIIQSNCKAIYIPFNPRNMKNRIPTPPEEKGLLQIQRLRDAGIYVYTSGIYGVPDLEDPGHFFSDMDRLSDTHYELVKRGVFDATLVFPLAILPGTRWWNELTVKRDSGLIYTSDEKSDFIFDQKKWLEYSIFVPQLQPRRVSRLDLELKLLEIHKKINENQVSMPWFSPFPNAL